MYSLSGSRWAPSPTKRSSSHRKGAISLCGKSAGEPTTKPSSQRRSPHIIWPNTSPPRTGGNGILFAAQCGQNHQAWRWLVLFSCTSGSLSRFNRGAPRNNGSQLRTGQLRNVQKLCPRVDKTTVRSSATTTSPWQELPKCRLWSGYSASSSGYLPCTPGHVESWIRSTDSTSNLHTKR